MSKRRFLAGWHYGRAIRRQQQRRWWWRRIHLLSLHKYHHTTTRAYNLMILMHKIFLVRPLISFLVRSLVVRMKCMQRVRETHVHLFIYLNLFVHSHFIIYSFIYLMLKWWCIKKIFVVFSCCCHTTHYTLYSIAFCDSAAYNLKKTLHILRYTVLNCGVDIR